MAHTTLQKNRTTPRTELRCSEEMKQQLKSIASPRSPIEDSKLPNLKIVTFDSDLENAVPDPVVMWEKSTCC